MRERRHTRHIRTLRDSGPFSNSFSSELIGRWHQLVFLSGNGHGPRPDRLTAASALKVLNPHLRPDALRVHKLTMATAQRRVVVQMRRGSPRMQPEQSSHNSTGC